MQFDFNNNATVIVRAWEEVKWPGTRQEFMEKLHKALEGAGVNVNRVPEGTLIENTKESGYRSSGVFIKVNGSVDGLYSEVDEYGTPHPEWCTITELKNPFYWADPVGREKFYWHAEEGYAPYKPHMVGQFVQRVNHVSSMGPYGGRLRNEYHVYFNWNQKPVSFVLWSSENEAHLAMFKAILGCDLVLEEMIDLRRYCSSNKEVVDFYLVQGSPGEYYCLLEHELEAQASTIATKLTQWRKFYFGNLLANMIFKRRDRFLSRSKTPKKV